MRRKKADTDLSLLSHRAYLRVWYLKARVGELNRASFLTNIESKTQSKKHTQFTVQESSQQLTVLSLVSFMLNPIKLDCMIIQNMYNSLLYTNIIYNLVMFVNTVK